MSARIRFQFAGSQLPVVIERLKDGAWWDGAKFVPPPGLPAPVMLTQVVQGIVGLSLPATGWADGTYGVYACDLDKNGAFAAVDSRYSLTSFTLFNGDDSPLPPAIVTISANAGVQVVRSP